MQASGFRGGGGHLALGFANSPLGETNLAPPQSCPPVKLLANWGSVCVLNLVLCLFLYSKFLDKMITVITAAFFFCICSYLMH